MPKSRKELVSAVMEAVAEFQDSTEAVDEAAARRLGVNRTDLRCLGILGRSGGLTAGLLAAGAGLSSGAATTAIDRLVRAGYAQRVRDGEDRRRVTVRLTRTAVDLLDEIWGPIGRESREALLTRGQRELEVIHDFLVEGREFQLAHAARIGGSDGEAPAWERTPLPSANGLPAKEERPPAPDDSRGR